MIRKIETGRFIRDYGVQEEFVDGVTADKIFESFDSNDLDKIQEGETIIDNENSRTLIKVDGAFNKLALDSNNNIILEEI